MGRILFLEDDPEIADAVTRLLQLGPHQVRHTDNGKRAVLLAAREPFDLALLDIEVEELSGLGAERAIADFGGIPVVVFSASATHWQPQAFRGGAVACLRKPADLHRLRPLVETLLGNPRDESQVDVTALPPEDLARLRALSREQLDALPFGVIELDRAGTIVGFNAYEASTVHLNVADLIGRSFADVAPCTQVKAFLESVADGFRRGELDQVMRFVFPCHGTMSVVAVRLYLDPARQRLWLFVSRRLRAAGGRYARGHATRSTASPTQR